MKALLVSGLFALTMTQAFAGREAMELTKYASEAVTVNSARTNIDRSVTFTNISVARGDQTFNIDASRTSYRSVCKMLGYEDSLTGYALNSTEKNGPGFWTLVALNEYGQYNGTISSDMRMSKVTCFNSSELKPAIDFNRKINADGSSTITNITYSRGDMVYNIDAKQSSYRNICRLVGFDDSLTGSGLNASEKNGPGFWTLVAVNEAGQYVNTISSDVRVSKVTCFSGREPEFVVLVDGVRYRHQ